MSLTRVAESLVQDTFGVPGKARQLDGEVDLNFRVDTPQGQSYVLKLHGPDTDDQVLDLQNRVMEHLAHTELDLQVPRVVPTLDGQAMATVDWPAGPRRARLLTWLDGRPWDSSCADESGLELLGAKLGGLNRALAEFTHPAQNREDLLWRMTAADDVAQLTDEVDRELRGLVVKAFEDHDRLVAPVLGRLPWQVVHHDANENNILVDAENRPVAVIDFGDLALVPRVVELAVASAYLGVSFADPVDAVAALARGYDREQPLTTEELGVLVDLVRTRLAMSVTLAAHQGRMNPDNLYLQTSQKGVRAALERLSRVDRDLARQRLRYELGYEAEPAARSVRGYFASGAGRPAPALPGGEVQDLYEYGAQRSREEREDDGAVGHAVSRGVRVMAGTSVHAPLEAEVRTACNGLVQLAHLTDDGVEFYSSWRGVEPAAGLEPGTRLKTGDEFAQLTAAGILEIQLATHPAAVRDGFRSPVDPAQFDLWRSLHPDPWPLVPQLDPRAARVEREPTALLQRRHAHFSRAMSISYDEPLTIVRGRGARLYDHSGRAYLDLVNNVCHVGHSHPRVVEAAHRQALTLNTNMRYLHDSVVEYSHRLLELFPDPLRVCFIVNSGSEANDLALRLAHAHTQASDALVLDHAYHGNSPTQIGLSPYKFNRAGGAGCPETTWVCDLPDLFRGPHRDLPLSEQVTRYVDSVACRLDELRRLNRRPAAFFVEPLQSCGGQVILPPGYLHGAAERVRAAGALVVADEVQVGLGRVGSHAWGFELSEVVPDIVTMGKPLGNGHPLAAVVTTPEVARSFETGMEWFNTFGGNPVSAEVGLAVLDVLRDERLQANARDVGARMLGGLSELASSHPLIGDVRGAGLFVGIELSHPDSTPATQEAKLLKEAAKQRGVLLSTDGPHENVLKIKPPMVVNDHDCDEFLQVFAAALEEIEALCC